MPETKFLKLTRRKNPAYFHYNTDVGIFKVIPVLHFSENWRRRQINPCLHRDQFLLLLQNEHGGFRMDDYQGSTCRSKTEMFNIHSSVKFFKTIHNGQEAHSASLRKEVNNFLEKKRRNEALVCIKF